MITEAPKVRKLIGLLYLAGGFLIADQLADLLGTLASAPVQWSSAQWRFGAFGLLVTRGSVLIVAEVMLWAAALLLDHRRMVRALAVLNLLLAVAAAAALGLFSLDAIEFRRQVKPESASRYDSAALRAMLVTLTGVVLLAWSGVAGWASSARRGERGEPAAVVVGGRKVKGNHR